MKKNMKQDTTKNDTEKLKLEIQRKLAYHSNRTERLNKLIGRKSTESLSPEKRARMERRLRESSRQATRLQTIVEQFIVQES